ncbi:MAG: TrmH family RNA methyltransferase [Smithellaceae bacterium]
MQTDFPNASQNQLKKWARLAEVKFRREDGLFLAEGVKVVEELLKSDWLVEAILVLPEKISYWEKLIPAAHEKGPVFQLTRPEWKKLSQDKEPEGIIAIVKSKTQPSLSSFLKSANGHVLILHEINNPGNLGALMRSACWFGFAGILLSPNSVDWTNPKVIRASMGSIFHLTVLSEVDVNASLSEIKQDYVLIGSDVREGTSPHPPAQKAALLLGSESHGLPDNLSGQVSERWCIPGSSQADSLSLPQAAAIMMYEMTRKG